jgi:homoserine kinase type II
MLNEAPFDALLEALGRLGVTARSVERIPIGRMNETWRVESDEGAYALRRYRDERTESAIAYEHDVIAHLAGRGWPVARPLAGDGGGTWTTVDGRRYAAFPWLPGERGLPRTARQQRVKGRLLARLHRDLAAFHATEQRDGWGRVWEMDRLFSGGAHASFADALSEFAKHEPALASSVRQAKYRMLRELARLGYGEQPDALIHFDFHDDNLLFSRGTMTGLLDMDSVHLDARVVDIAATIANDCAAPPADIVPAIDATAALVEGYREHTPLEEAELRLIVPAIRSYWVWSMPAAVRRWLIDRDDSHLARLRRRLDARLPALDDAQPVLERAIIGGG